MWVSKEEKKYMEEYAAQQEKYLFGIEPSPEPKPICNKKWAWIEVDGERQMQWVDNVTMKAYKRDGYETTDVEIPNYKFERWCRPMDL
jgi:hypothetical protein